MGRLKKYREVGNKEFIDHLFNPRNAWVNSFAKKYLEGRCCIGYYDAIRKLTKALLNDKVNFNLIEVSNFLKNHPSIKKHSYQGSKPMNLNMVIIHSKINKMIPSKSIAMLRYMKSISSKTYKYEELPF